MKHLKLFFALFAMLALGVGNAWGAEVNYTFNTDAGIAELGVTKPAVSAGTDLDANKSYVLGDVSMKVTHASTKTRVYNSNGKLDLRIYKNGGTLTFSVPSGSISKVVFAGATTNVFTASIGTLSNSTWTGEAASVTFTATNTGKINTITVTYETSGGETPDPTPDPEEPDPTPDPEPGPGGETWTLVTNASNLKVGDQIVIAATESNYALGPQANNNRTAVAITKTGNNITWTTNVQIITLEAGNKANTFAFTTGSGYLYAASSTANHLKTKTTLDDNGSWTISIASSGVATIKAQGTNTRNWIRKNNSDAIFSCYGSGQDDVAIYKKTDASTPSISVAPSSHTFETTNVGETATQEFTITAKNTEATLSASIDNTTDFAISAITGDKVTVTYQPQSAGDHTATMTVKAGEEASTTVALTGKAVAALKGTWMLVTDASTLKAGNMIVIAAKETDVALSTDQKNNNRGQVEITKNNDNTITATTEAQVLTLQAGKAEGTWALYTGAGYLYAVSSSDNYLRTETTLSDNSSWKISVADGATTLIAQGDKTRNVMQYNETSDLFSCYASASQEAIAIYSKVYNVKATAANGSISGAGKYYNHGSEVTLKATANTGYEFVNWTKGDEEVSTNATYTFTATEDVTLVANFKQKEYTVKFLNYDDEVLQSSQVKHGETPTYSESDPKRAADAQYTYTFSGWDKELTAVTSNQTYKAQYTSTINKYTITFNNWDDTKLTSYEVEYGQTPVYAGEAPTKAATAEHTYTFSGWDPEIAAVTGEATYTATYSQTLNQYTITATATNGTVTGAETYTHGAKVTLTADPAMDYTFVNWTVNDTEVSIANPFVFEATENVELVANFKAIPERTTDLTGIFSVGLYEVAQFATGNLQYNVKDEKWSFAKQQYQYIGDANINVGDPTFTGTIDMFGWSTNETNYGVDPRNVNEFYDGEFVDWGDLFPVEDNWSTLSADQWKYLLNTRPNASSLKQIARVGSVVGIMLFPDVWNAPLTVTAQRDSYFDVDIHNYTLEQWAALENAGALFLPAAGRRTGGYGNMINYDQEEETNSENLNGGHYKHQDNTNIYCYYWTSTINEDKKVSYLHNIVALGNNEYTIGTGAIWGEKGRYGQSVRLAKVTNTLVPITEGDNTEVLNNNDGKNVDVKVTREFTTGNLYTIALPFTLENVSSVFGNQAYEYTSLGENGEGVVLYFSKTNTMESGKPYLIEPTQDVLGFIVEDVTLSNTANNIAFTVDKTTVTMIPVLSVTEGADNNGKYWLAADRYLYNNTNTLMSLRALFNISTVNGVAPRARVAFSENSTTGLDNITNGENTTIKVIENGQLIIIRNGEKFNAQGVKF